MGWSRRTFVVRAIDATTGVAAAAVLAVTGHVDAVPVGLALGEAKPKTIEIGVPAVLISRQIMGPVSVLIAWAVSLVVL